MYTYVKYFTLNRWNITILKKIPETHSILLSTWYISEI